MASNSEIEKIIKAVLNVKVIHRDEHTAYIKIETPSKTSISVRIDLKDIMPDVLDLPIGRPDFSL